MLYKTPLYQVRFFKVATPAMAFSFKPYLLIKILSNRKSKLYISLLGLIINEYTFISDGKSEILFGKSVKKEMFSYIFSLYALKKTVYNIFLECFAH